MLTPHNPPSLGGDAELWTALKKAAGLTAVEVCLTSNVTCSTVASYADHHVELLRKEKVCCGICAYLTVDVALGGIYAFV